MVFNKVLMIKLNLKISLDSTIDQLCKSNILIEKVKNAIGRIIVLEHKFYRSHFPGHGSGGVQGVFKGFGNNL